MSGFGAFAEAVNRTQFAESGPRRGHHTIQNRLRRCVVVYAPHYQVSLIGSTVPGEGPGKRRESFTIVGSPEAKPMEGASQRKPGGPGLDGKHVGEKVATKVPSGVLEYHRALTDRDAGQYILKAIGRDAPGPSWNVCARPA
jgi:hypothetical protein